MLRFFIAICGLLPIFHARECLGNNHAQKPHPVKIKKPRNGLLNNIKSSKLH
jgi:hypothetical protein